jgi:hypothetical protein
MNKTSLTLMALAPLCLAGCHGAILGNLFVLGITVGIFVATLSLGRVAASTSTASRSAETSTSSHG